MEFDYPELRAWLADQENFQSNMMKSPWTCTIKDNQQLNAVQMLDIQTKIQPSSIVIKKDDGTYIEFWWEVYINQQETPYDIRLATYPFFYFIY
jgi:hypothetical protein